VKQSLDARDYSKFTKVELDIPSAVRNLERAKKFMEDGTYLFPRGADWIKAQDWTAVR
jgi:hypothetical protein